MIDDALLGDEKRLPSKPRAPWGLRHIPAAICITFGATLSALVILAIAIHLYAWMTVPLHRPWGMMPGMLLFLVTGAFWVVAGIAYARRRAGRAVALTILGWALGAGSMYLLNLDKT